MSQAHRVEEIKQTMLGTDTGTSTGTGATPTQTSVAEHVQPEREKHSYTHKKMGDILDEMNDMLSHRREQMMIKASEKVNGLLDELNGLYDGLKTMATESPQNVDPLVIKHKQNQLSHIENKAVQGIYGAEAKICPLDQAGQPVHHVRIQAIPPGQATIRDLIERCHQMITRVLDRMEETVTSLSGSEQGTSAATSTTTVHTAGTGTGAGAGTGTGTTGHTGHIQTHATGVTLTEGQGEGYKQRVEGTKGRSMVEGSGTGTGHGAGHGVSSSH